MKTSMEELAPYMRGWRSYFGFGETPEVLDCIIATQVCYSGSVPSVTSSFRMSQDLQRALSDAAERTGKGKNAIIIEALVKYLSAMERQSLAEEARRQSELVRSEERRVGKECRS